MSHAPPPSSPSASSLVPPPRYAPQREFPAYAYITGHAPHPRRDPRGHSFGVPESAPPQLDASRPFASDDFLFGIDLFNHGYYWEAHEAWEGLWRASRDEDRAAGREASARTLFLQALIKLAAAGFKVRQGRPDGVRRHATTAARVIRSVLDRSGGGSPAGCFAGVDLVGLIERIEKLAQDPPEGSVAVDERPQRVLSPITLAGI